MNILAIIVFSFCAWAVFSHRFRDGIIAKNFLSLAAILSFLAIVDRHNYAAGITSLVMLCMGLAYAFYKNNVHVVRPSTKHRHF